VYSVAGDKIDKKTSLPLQLRQMAEFRRDNAKLIKDLMPEQEKIPFMEGGVVNVLTNKDHKNRRVLIVNSGKLWDPSVVSADSMFRMFYLSESSTSLPLYLSFSLSLSLLTKSSNRFVCSSHHGAAREVNTDLWMHCHLRL
jgi:hypothetical protein